MTGESTRALSLTAAAQAIAEGSLTARALAERQLARIEATDGAIGAWAHLDAAHVRAEADRCDAAIGARPAAVIGAPHATGLGSLHGIGIGVKDIIDTVDASTEMGSPIYAGHRPDKDAECVTRLKRAGGYVFGKAVTTAFAFLDPAKTRNPWNPRHTPGGSSSGSAAAVASGHVAGAIGTQTNGSVIRPAAYCGVVGYKPTKDAVPHTGVHLFSETLDQLGTFTRSVADAARLASALAGTGHWAQLGAPMKRPPRLAYLDGFPWTREVDCDADDTLDAAATTLRKHGAEVVAVGFPAPWREVNRVHKTIMLYEAGTYLAALQDRERARLTPNLNAALDEGRKIARADYEAALERRRAAIKFFADWLAAYDAIIAPAAPGPAPEGLDSTGDPSCCTLWSLTGFPALTLPIGVAPNGLPLGMQLAAPGGEDDRLLAIATWCEARLPFHGLV